MNVSFTEAQAKALLVAIRVTTVVHTELVGMTPDKDIRSMLMTQIADLEKARRKLDS